MLITARLMAIIGDENAGCAPAPLKTGSRAMQNRRYLKENELLQDRLASFAKEARAKAWVLPSGAEKDDLLRRARQADTAAQLDDWINSPGLQLPK